MRTSRKGSVEMPAFVRQLVKETEKKVSSFFKGGRGGAVEGEPPGGEGEKEEVIPSPYLDRPVLDKLTEEGCSRWGLTYALGSMQGWRANMEDFHNCVPQLGGELADWSFFAVFDGHAGSTAAQYCSQHLLGHILATGESKRLCPGSLSVFCRHLLLFSNSLMLFHCVCVCVLDVQVAWGQMTTPSR